MKRHFYAATAVIALMALMLPVAAQAATEEDFVPQGLNKRGHTTFAHGCLDVYDYTPQEAAYGTGDSIPVRLVIVAPPTKTCLAKTPEVKLVPAPSATAQPPTPPPAAASPATVTHAGKEPDKEAAAVSADAAAGLKASPTAPTAATTDIAPPVYPEPLAVPFVDLESIADAVRNQRLGSKASDVVPVWSGKPVEYPIDERCGRTCGVIYVVDFEVTQFITMQTVKTKEKAGEKKDPEKKDDAKRPPDYRDTATITADFDFAITLQADGQPQLQTVQIPPLTVGIHQSAHIKPDPNLSQSELIEGDLSAMVSPIAPVALWLNWITAYLNLTDQPEQYPPAGPAAIAMAGTVAIGPTAVLIWLAQFAVWFVRREQILSRNQRLWRRIDDAVASGLEEAKTRTATALQGGNAAVSEDTKKEEDYFPIERYRQIFNIIRTHLGVTGESTTRTLEILRSRTDPESGRLVFDSEAVASVFQRETMFFDEENRMTAEEREELLANIAVLIPRR
jgi:hypothetical protein